MGAGILDEDKFAFVGEPAWHGLGQKVAEGLDAVTVFKLVGLDWQTKLWPLMSFVPPVVDDGAVVELAQPGDDSVSVDYEARRLRIINTILATGAPPPDEDQDRSDRVVAAASGKFSHVRVDTGRVLGVVSGSYQPLENMVLAEFVDSLVRVDGKVCVETAGSLWNGRVVYVLVRLPDVTELITGDVVKHYLLAVNGHGGHRMFSVYYTSIRVVCANTLRASEVDMASGVSFRHIGGKIEEKLQAAATVLGLASAEIKKMDTNIRLLAATPMSITKHRLFMTKFVYPALFGDVTAIAEPELKDKAVKMRDTMVETWMQNLLDPRQAKHNPDTLWASFNAISQWVEHERGRGGQAKTNTNINSRLFGTGHEMKVKAFKAAMAVASGHFELVA